VCRLAGIAVVIQHPGDQFIDGLRFQSRQTFGSFPAFGWYCCVNARCAKTFCFDVAAVGAYRSAFPWVARPEQAESRRADSRCQVIVSGRVTDTVSARNYYRHNNRLLDVISASLESLREAYDIVLIEGAGSPAEINLREHDIVNMRIALLADAPVLLAGDIDKGGVFASFVGTLALLKKREREFVKGFIINKFRGDLKLLQSGLDMLEFRTGRPVLGVVPYFHDISIAAEDSASLNERVVRRGNNAATEKMPDIAIIRLPHIANYDEFDSLAGEDCLVRYVERPEILGTPDLIILPGSKSTISDLDKLWKSGMADLIIEQAEKHVPVIGICGGYQMLGKKITDGNKTESSLSAIRGLGLLDVETAFKRQKRTAQVSARIISGAGILASLKGLEVSGYEIHMGQCSMHREQHLSCVFQPPQGEEEYLDGAVNPAGTVIGTYIHGLFDNAAFRRGLLSSLRNYRGLPSREYSGNMEADQYDKLAQLVREHIDMKQIRRIIERGINE
jgi:adenosylcobyric acid synthase